LTFSNVLILSKILGGTNTTWVRARFYKSQKGCTRLATTSDKVYQLLAHGRFSLGTPVSSTTKAGRHDIAEILLKVALNTTKIKLKSKEMNDVPSFFLLLSTLDGARITVQVIGDECYVYVTTYIFHKMLNRWRGDKN
jgi:hypothetical protein